MTGPRAIFYVAVGCLLFVVTTVQADLAPPCAHEPTVAPHRTADHPQQRAQQPRAGGLLTADLPGVTTPILPAAGQDESYAQALPAEPSSVGLFLAAMGGAFAWQLGRSARNLHFGAVPDWYHAGGPAQVGHATPLEADLSAPAALCLHVDTDIGEPENRYVRRFELDIPTPSQTHRWIEPTRGPPVLSF